MFRLFECCALSFFERFVLSFSLKIERFVSDSAEIWICGLYMNYKVIERKDPRNPEAPGKYYGFIVNLSKIGIEEIATRISGTCTVTRHDCLAVLSALQEQIIYALQEGKRVHLGDIGSFRTVANGLGSDTAEKYDPAYITKLRVCFTPNTKLKKAMSLDNKAFTLERVDFLPEEEDSEEEGDI